MYYLTLPYIVLNSSFISWRCALHLVVTTWIMASSSVPKPFIAFLKYSQSASQLQFSPSMKYRASCWVWSIYEARKTQTLDLTMSALIRIFMITSRKTINECWQNTIQPFLPHLMRISPNKLQKATPVSCTQSNIIMIIIKSQLGCLLVLWSNIALYDRFYPSAMLVWVVKLSLVVDLDWIMV